MPLAPTPFPEPPANIVDVTDDGTSTDTVLVTFDRPVSLADYAASIVFILDTITNQYAGCSPNSQVTDSILSLNVGAYSVPTIPPGASWYFAPASDLFTPGQQGSTS